MATWKMSARRTLPVRVLVPASLLLCVVACGEREAAPPPDAQPAVRPAVPDSAPARPDTLVGDSVMARDTLWSPQP